MAAVTVCRPVGLARAGGSDAKVAAVCIDFLRGMRSLPRGGRFGLWVWAGAIRACVVVSRLGGIEAVR
ncbi:putative nucleoside-diphosphate sugar epimerase [Methylobacterium sp. ME121]|nr:putative nucleoside-diphosphate sugar epimerase [Methylobacterium sp. ME121]GEM96549.1 hypothetical protein MRA01_10890 [Methylobacterium radiotolerans]